MSFDPSWPDLNSLLIWIGAHPPFDSDGRIGWTVYEILETNLARYKHGTDSPDTTWELCPGVDPDHARKSLRLVLGDLGYRLLP